MCKDCSKKKQKNNSQSYKIITGRERSENSNPIRKQLDELDWKITELPYQAAAELFELYEKYPEPEVLNNLIEAYLNAGEKEQALYFADKLFKNFPNYFYSRINMAHSLIENGQHQEIPALFNNALDIQDLYPERTEFHIDEIVAFFTVMFRYHCKIHDELAAVNYLTLLIELIAKDEDKEDRIIMPLMDEFESAFPDFDFDDDEDEEYERGAVLNTLPFDISFNIYDLPYPRSIIKEVVALRNDKIENPQKAIKKLQELIQKYPDAPSFYDSLAQAYSNYGDVNNLNQTIVKAFELFPHDLFIRCIKAQMLIETGYFYEVPAVFQHKFDLQSLYPNRSTFYLEEVINFSEVMLDYYCFARNQVGAAFHYAVLYELLEDGSEEADERLELAVNKMFKAFPALEKQWMASEDYDDTQEELDEKRQISSFMNKKAYRIKNYDDEIVH